MNAEFKGRVLRLEFNTYSPDSFFLYVTTDHDYQPVYRFSWDADLTFEGVRVGAPDLLRRIRLASTIPQNVVMVRFTPVGEPDDRFTNSAEFTIEAKT